MKIRVRTQVIGSDIDLGYELADLPMPGDYVYDRQGMPMKVQRRAFLSYGIVVLVSNINNGE